VDAAVNSYQYESQIQLNDLGVSNQPSVYFHIVDWNNKGDYSDSPIITKDQNTKVEVTPAPGMRGVTTYLVINEIYYASGVLANQWIEVANPTGGALGNGYDIYDLTSTTEIVTISSDISAGGFAFYTPTSAFSLGDVLQLRDASDVVVDRVDVPNPWGGGATDSYARLKDIDTNPYDTGAPNVFNSGDFYYDNSPTQGSANNQTIPEFPTMLLPVFSLLILIAIVSRRRRW
jgi:hypothetical protein